MARIGLLRIMSQRMKMPAGGGRFLISFDNRVT